MFLYYVLYNSKCLELRIDHSKIIYKYIAKTSKITFSHVINIRTLTFPLPLNCLHDLVQIYLIFFVNLLNFSMLVGILILQVHLNTGCRLVQATLHLGIYSRKLTLIFQGCLVTGHDHSTPLFFELNPVFLGSLAWRQQLIALS